MKVELALKDSFWTARHQKGKQWLQKPIIRLLSRFSLPEGIAIELSWWLPYRDKLPVVNERHKVILFHSPKAGGGTAIKWFLQASGKLEEALRYSNWVHAYINERYYQEEALFMRFPKKLSDPVYRKMKVVRHPFSRFISSFYHFIKHQETYVSLPLPRDFCANDFIDLLATQPSAFLNPHFAPQLSVWETLYPNLIDEVIHLENIEEELNALNEKWQLATPFDQNLVEQRHAIKQNEGITYNTPLHLLPGAQLLQNPPADLLAFFKDTSFKNKVYTLFRADFEAYGYVKDHLKPV